METTTKPLYKVLDEKRSKGFIEVSNESEPDLTLWIKSKVSEQTNQHECIGTIWANDKTEANAQYIALCVNNMAGIVEALEGLIKAADHSNCDSISVDKAKEALSKIS